MTLFSDPVRSAAPEQHLRRPGPAGAIGKCGSIRECWGEAHLLAILGAEEGGAAGRGNERGEAGRWHWASVGRSDQIHRARRARLTRLWYLRPVDPRTVLYTGLTRDGTFLIENGKISKAIKNMRFNESPLFLLNNLETLGRAERVAGTEAGGDVVMPRS